MLYVLVYKDSLKGTVHPKIKNTYFFLNLDYFAESCLVLEILLIFCLFSNIMGLNDALNVLLTVPEKYI